MDHACRSHKRLACALAADPQARPLASGHIWQGRFKAFPIEEDEHLLTVLRYIDRNPVRANLTAGAEDWPWSSARFYEGFEDVVIWLGMLAPAGTPEPIAKKLVTELMRIAHLPDVRKRIKESSSVLVGGTGEDFADAITRETPVWASIIKQNNITLGN